MLVCYSDIYLNHESLLTSYAFVSMTYVYSNTPPQLRHTSKVIIRDSLNPPISQTPKTKLNLKITKKHINSPPCYSFNRFLFFYVARRKPYWKI